MRREWRARAEQLASLAKTGGIWGRRSRVARSKASLIVRAAVVASVCGGALPLLHSKRPTAQDRPHANSLRATSRSRHAGGGAYQIRANAARARQARPRSPPTCFSMRAAACLRPSERSSCTKSSWEHCCRKGMSLSYSLESKLVMPPGAGGRDRGATHLQWAALPGRSPHAKACAGRARAGEVCSRLLRFLECSCRRGGVKPRAWPHP